MFFYETPCSKIGYWHRNVICVSVMLCIVAKQYILQVKPIALK